MSWLMRACLWITATTIAALSAGLPLCAQYPGQIANPDKNTPELRAVAVLEWTGDQNRPKTSRLVPVCVYDGKDLQDASVYMARPEPLALEGEVEYQLLENGKPSGLFVVENSGREQGSWVGFGKWKPLPKPKPAPVQVAKIDEGDAQSDTPVLHRKHHDENSSNGSGSDSSAPPADPDRPTLHKGGDASGDSSDKSDSGPAADHDRPTLHRSDNQSSTGDADRPKLSKKKQDDNSYVEDVATVTDPNRPKLIRGKSDDLAITVLPSLMGLPPDMQQMVAVSDVKAHPEHLWDFSWGSPDDEAKMKSEMEDLARAALGLKLSAMPVAKTASKAAATATHRAAKPAAAPVPAPLIDEQFRVFELAYSSGATMVLTARTDGADGAPVKYVTLIGQPDLYGHVAVLVKNVADSSHLDDVPRMRLVDAVDAMANNRGELLFELRGTTQRQFALYRVLRGQAERIFVSGADAIGNPNGD